MVMLPWCHVFDLTTGGKYTSGIIMTPDVLPDTFIGNCTEDPFTALFDSWAYVMPALTAETANTNASIFKTFIAFPPAWRTYSLVATQRKYLYRHIKTLSVSYIFNTRPFTHGRY
jgi:hypothetical protein